MISRLALIAVLAAAAANIQNADAFVAPSSSYTIRQTSLFTSSEQSQSEQVTEASQEADTTKEADKLIMDIPPSPDQAEAAAKPAAKKAAPKKKGNPHKEGVFSPIVVAAGAILGEEALIKIRGKVIALHSDLIKSFVGTSDSAFGQAVLKQIFNFVDTDNSGYLDKAEVAVALDMLGFKWLGEKQVGKIFQRADDNGDEEISLEEFMSEAPKTLKVNLVKLAKANGGEMGLLS